MAKASAAARSVDALRQSLIDAAIDWQQAPDIAVAMTACRKLDAAVRDYVAATKPTSDEPEPSRWNQRPAASKKEDANGRN